jgi:hypothetical protein
VSNRFQRASAGQIGAQSLSDRTRQIVSTYGESDDLPSNVMSIACPPGLR